MAVIKTFMTPGGMYVYDRETNSILSVSKDEFAVCQKIEAGNDTSADWEALKRLTQHGYLKESSLQWIEHSATSLMRYFLDSGVTQLTLQCDQRCNLACLYCTYSGNYENQRTHSNLSMSLDMMKKGVDFLMSRSRNVKEVALGYYGGDPLLQFENIKKLVAYVKEEYQGRRVRHTMTTNGTLFNDEILTFLQENNFNVSISLDGPKFLHDQNRVFPDGSGSFDIIMENVMYIREAYPKLYENVMFLSTVAPGVDFACVNDFYNAEDVLADGRVMQNMVVDHGAKEPVIYDDLYNTTYTYNQMKVLLSALGLYSKEKISKLFSTGLSNAVMMHKHLSIVKMPERAHPSGPCIPGVLRPIIDVHGHIYPCERVSEYDTMKIGHIDSGFDLDKALTILNVGKMTEDECKNCWSFSHCGLCAAACDGDGGLTREARLNNCNRVMAGTIDTFATICLLLENGYDFEKKTTIGGVSHE